MDAEIVKTFDWSLTATVDDAHTKMVEMMTSCFADNGASPSMWLVVSPKGTEAAVVITAWRNEREKLHAVATMRDAIASGPGGGQCPMYSFSCEAMMKVMGAEEYVPGTHLKPNDPRVEDIAFVSSYDAKGNGRFSRFGVKYGKRKDFGTLMARDDWDLSAPDTQDRLSGLLMNLYLPDPDAGPVVRCPHCSKAADSHLGLATSGEPGDGDVMLCIRCGEVSTFDSRTPYGARKATQSELGRFMLDPRVKLGSMLIKSIRE